MNEWLEWFAVTVSDSGAAGVFALAVVYILATLLLLPGAFLGLLAGFLYGPVWGTLLVSPVSVVAATLAFLLGRTLLRDRISRTISRNSRFGAIDRAIGERGFLLVLLLRLSPIIPFNLLNYSLGLTPVRLRDYVSASFFGMLPGTALYVSLGSLVPNLTGLGQTSQYGDGGSASRMVYFIGVIATLLLVVLLGRIARRALQKHIS